MDSWYEIKDYRKGELVGKIIGKYGVDVFLVAGATKGVNAYLNLRKANAMLTLDNMRILEKRRIQKEISAQWEEHINSTSEKIKTSRKLAKELSEKFKNQNLSEFQARKIKQTGEEIIQMNRVLCIGIFV